MDRMIVKRLFLLGISFFSMAVYADDSTGLLPAKFMDISNWLYHLALQVQPLIVFVVALCYVTGFGLVIMGILKLKQFAQNVSMMSSQHSLVGPLIYFFTGVALMFFPAFVNVGTVTVFSSAPDEYAYTSLTGLSFLDGFLGPVFLIIRLIGYVAFFRGWLLLLRLGERGGGGQAGTMSKALMHMGGGILAINIEYTWQVLMNTLTGA